MLGELVGDARLDAPRRRRIERHQAHGGVDQLAVQRPVVVAADLAAGGHRRVRRDAPAGQSGAVQHVLVTAPDDDHRMVQRNGVEVAPQRQALLGELRLVPVGVRDHDSTGCGFAHRPCDGRQHLGERARAGQVQPRPAPPRPAPPLAERKWLSASPGTTVRPPRSITRVAAVSCTRTSVSVPHGQDPAAGDGDRPPAAAASSTVMTLPLTRTSARRRGASVGGVATGLSKRQPVVRVRPENEVLDVGLELAPPVGRVPRNDHDVPLGDAPRHAPLDARPRTLVLFGARCGSVRAPPVTSVATPSTM